MQIAERHDRFFFVRLYRTKVGARTKEKHTAFPVAATAISVTFSVVAIVIVLIGRLFSQEKFIWKKKRKKFHHYLYDDVRMELIHRTTEGSSSNRPSKKIFAHVNCPSLCVRDKLGS